MPTPLDNHSKAFTAVAMHWAEARSGPLFPEQHSWQQAPTICFDRDWRGEHPDPQRATEVRVLWTPAVLFLRFHMTYRTVSVYTDSREDGWRDELWNRDVAEAFLQPDASDPLHYAEFEVSPNGLWIDLDIFHGQRKELRSGLKRRVAQDQKEKTWTAELALPMKSLTSVFNPKQTWRANFFRVEGESEPRFYSAWSPTYSPRPNFHVPSAFGTLRFE